MLYVYLQMCNKNCHLCHHDRCVNGNARRHHYKLHSKYSPNPPHPPTPLQLREETLLLINCQLLKPFVALLILLDANTFQKAGAFEDLLILYLIDVIFSKEAGAFDVLLILLDANTFQKASAFEALLIL